MNFVQYSWEDMKKQKSKMFFGIAGIAISILLLTAIGVVNDSLSASYLDQATTQVGSADIVFTKSISSDLTFDPFFDESIIQDRLVEQVPDIDYFFPRLFMLIQAQRIDPKSGQLNSSQVMYYGLDTALEAKSEKLGTLWILNENMQRTNEKYEGTIENGHCIILKGMALFLNKTAGDNVTVQYLSQTRNLTIDYVVEQETRFTIAESSLIITSLAYAQEFLDQPGKVNYVMATLKNREMIYDARDIDQTRRDVRAIGERIQEQIGFDYMIRLPKMEQLSASEYVTMTMTTMFWFLTFLTMMIASILINSILSTSIEERIREFGVMRVVGSRRSFTIKIVVMQGFIMGVIASIIGTVLGIILTPIALRLYLYEVLKWSIKINFVWQPITIIQSLAIGIGVTTIISLIPAIRAGKFQLTNAIDPARNHQRNDYAIVKEGSANSKLVLVGVGISTSGLIIFILLPRIISQGSIILLVSVFVALHLAILIGLVFACIGLVPVLEMVVAQVFKPFISKYFPIYKTSLLRHRRRNTGNAVMFAMTFALIFFLSSYAQMESANTDTSMRFQYGSDLVIMNNGTPEQGNAIDLQMVKDLQEIRGVRYVAPALYNAFDSTRILSLFNDFGEGFDLSDISMEDIFGSMSKIQTFGADVANFHRTEVGVCAITPEYLNVVDQRLITWDTLSGSNMESFDKVFEEPQSAIIAKNLADYFGITELGQYIRVTFEQYNAETDTHYSNITLFKVVGISRGIPGFWNFRSSSAQTWQGGILINMDNYCKYMNWGDPENPEMPVDKILIKLTRHDDKTIQETEEYLQAFFSEKYKYKVTQAITLINMVKSQNKTVSDILEVVLFAAIIISLFGLISTMYSTLLERMFEIGILRAMGMKSHEVRSLFIAESLTIVLAAGGLGTIIGSLIAYLLQYQMGMLLEMPIIFALNVGTLLRTFGACILVSIIGMFIITRKISKWSIMDILRQTF